jgi:hypothetical protein
MHTPATSRSSVPTPWSGMRALTRRSPGSSRSTSAGSSSLRSCPGRSRPTATGSHLPDHAPTFYSFFYCAGRNRKPRSSTGRLVRCAKPQLRGTGRHAAVRISRLVDGLRDRRSRFSDAAARQGEQPGVTAALVSIGQLAGGPVGCRPRPSHISSHNQLGMACHSPSPTVTNGPAQRHGSEPYETGGTSGNILQSPVQGFDSPRRLNLTRTVKVLMRPYLSPLESYNEPLSR